jgi:hypothetical protein
LANGFDGIITELEQQKAAIEKALAALRDMDGSGAPTASEEPVAATRKGGMSPEGKERLIKALKKRWAAKKAAAAATPLPEAVVDTAEASANRRSEGQKKRWAAKTAPATTKPLAPKGGMTEDGRKRLAEAMRKRWAVKRTAAQAKKSARRKAA